MKEYSVTLNNAINSDKKLKAKFIMIKRYLEIKMDFLRLYMVSLDDLDNEISLVLNN